MPVVEKTDNSNEEDSPSDIEDKKEKTKQMKAIIKRLESRPSRRMLQRCLDANHLLAAFMCNLCHELVRGGVITICGHLYCWACLWPELKVQKGEPHCPRCKYELILHEDLIPFLGEGPHDVWAGNVKVVAQPGNVPRPTGMYLADFKYPEWFSVLPMDEDHHKIERHLCLLEGLMLADPSDAGICIRLLKWFQYICVALMVLVFCLLTI